MTNKQKEDLWIKRIQDCKSSGKGKEQWCMENNVPRSTFWRWEKRFKRTTETLAPEPIPSEIKLPAVVLRYGSIEIELRNPTPDALVTLIRDLMEEKV